MEKQIKYVAQGLMKTWKEREATIEEFTNREENTAMRPYKRYPLMKYLRDEYNERYVKFCYKLNIKPQGFGAWLRKPITSIQ